MNSFGTHSLCTLPNVVYTWIKVKKNEIHSLIPALLEALITVMLLSFQTDTPALANSVDPDGTADRAAD